MAKTNSDNVKQRITCTGVGTFNAEDRVAIAQILVKAGYTVRIGKEKLPNKNTTTYFVEFWGEE